MPLLQKLGSVLFAFVVAIVVLAVVNWGTILQYRVESDLRDDARYVRKAAISLSEKEKLLDLIERLEDKVEAGQQFGWFEWSRHNDVVREIFHGGLDAGKVQLIERELLRAEKRLE